MKKVSRHVKVEVWFLRKAYTKKVQHSMQVTLNGSICQMQHRCKSQAILPHKKAALTFFIKSKNIITTWQIYLKKEAIDIMLFKKNTATGGSDIHQYVRCVLFNSFKMRCCFYIKHRNFDAGSSLAVSSFCSSLYPRNCSLSLFL